MPATTASMTRFVTAARRPGRAPIMMVSTAKLKVSQRLVTQTCGGQGWLSLVESACLVEVGCLSLLKVGWLGLPKFGLVKVEKVI